LFLARIYVDESARREFLADPAVAARRSGLSGDEARALEKIDRVGLELAARSFEKKRASQPRRSWAARLRETIMRLGGAK
jgi:hypothetical protein